MVPASLLILEGSVNFAWTKAWIEAGVPAQRHPGSNYQVGLASRIGRVIPKDLLCLSRVVSPLRDKCA